MEIKRRKMMKIRMLMTDRGCSCIIALSIPCMLYKLDFDLKLS